MTEHNPTEVVVFDFDGTTISGNSPVLLVRHLVAKRRLKFSVAFRILLWGAAYKLRLPQNESWVRGLVFTAFAGMPRTEVDDYLRAFYDSVIAKRVRPAAVDEMARHRAQGRKVMIVSASFEPIIERFLEQGTADYQVSTRMRVAPDGTYTSHVEGMPVEGQEKVSAVRRFADGAYGSGNWVLYAAYGDHHSDTPLLENALHAIAVTPDNPLERRAKRAGWTIEDWE